ncbi:TetR family transcriptional regulator [Leifsonia xyli subsp. cynodontis DSM 46306]|jgi:AcrR family transcriptional regulator|uniref:HTH tetR-type domain-containing protein n=1 Tax=Leifsonia xyli subsp. cynodontis DSM 46306 TaxID=1389489 RepID=U3PDF6_LEIXC|nr:TetR/AcrR family transcriptional regulator [Leifsonia xyli]AGW41573.1 TetR family transcriptional regulator [Leifsonia xyli subsp. cynodontis DSM 46306]
MNTRNSGSGRPRASSRAMLAEAAAELFLEQTYAGTTVDDIARRAGVSRATFFNYFASKSDLLWLEVDEALKGLPELLAAPDAGIPPMDAVLIAVLRLAEGFGPGRLPLAVTQVELMGTDAELQASALPRFLEVVRQVAAAIAARTGDDVEGLLPPTAAAAVVGAGVAAVGMWARAGVGRGPLAPLVREAVEPVCRGYSTALPSA